MRSETAGDFDYERHGSHYSSVRRPDPRIAAVVHRALGSARSVLNVGAGAGSYEPADRYVAAVEPSAAMRAQRPVHAVPAVDAIAESLPFDDDAFGAAMATITIHQWSDVEQGLREMRRVARGPVVILTFDGEALDRFWLAEYAPKLIAAERRRYPALTWIGEVLGGDVTVESVPVPVDCTDGFAEALYARPERFLEDAVRRSQSAWGFITPDEESGAVTALANDLTSGEWRRRFGDIANRPAFDGSLRLVTAMPTH